MTTTSVTWLEVNKMFYVLNDDTWASETRKEKNVSFFLDIILHFKTEALAKLFSKVKEWKIQYIVLNKRRAKVFWKLCLLSTVDKSMTWYKVVTLSVHSCISIHNEQYEHGFQLLYYQHKQWWKADILKYIVLHNSKELKRVTNS